VEQLLGGGLERLTAPEVVHWRRIQMMRVGGQNPMATILLIDDGEKTRKLGRIDLESAGYTFMSAATGQHGLRILEHQKVDLILVNIFMPDMDGVVLTQALRLTRPSTKIIAITAGKGLKNLLDLAKQLGADGTLEKPFTRQELLRVVTSHLGNAALSVAGETKGKA
jgi:CheY-like chemotaxis protein